MRSKLFIIFLLAFLLRVYQVHVNPPSLSWDEVSIGYNAYSILKTGRDEHGRFFPLDAFIAYGDYKPPVPIYVTVPFVAIFGLNALSVRMPVVLFGSLTVIVFYILVRELFKKSPSLNQLPLIASMLLAISPWHINLSRAGFEATIALFFIVLGIYLILAARRVPYLWLWAWVPFVCSMYTFNSARYFSIFMSFGILIYCRQHIRNHFNVFIRGVLVGIIALLPLMPHLVSSESRLRFAEVNIFTDATVVETANIRQARDMNPVSKLLDNRRIGYARSYLLHYLDNFEPRFLFIKGDGNPKFSIQDVGQFHLIEAPILAYGAIMLFLSYPSIGLFVLFWIFVAVAPAAVARETPHALRILNSAPAWYIFIAFGIYSLLELMRRRTVYLIVLIGMYSLSLVYYLHNYYRHYPTEFSAEWQYGYGEAFKTISAIESKYDRIVITNSIGRPYMYTLFYTQTNPNIFFQTKYSYFDAAGFYHVDSFGKYQFNEKYPDSLPQKTLWVWDAGAIPQGARVIETVKLLNGNPVLTIFDNGSAQL